MVCPRRTASKAAAAGKSIGEQAACAARAAAEAAKAAGMTAEEQVQAATKAALQVAALAALWFVSKVHVKAS